MVGREEMNGVGEIIIGEWIGEMGVKKHKPCLISTLIGQTCKKW